MAVMMTIKVIVEPLNQKIFCAKNGWFMNLSRFLEYWLLLAYGLDINEFSLRRIYAVPKINWQQL